MAGSAKKLTRKRICSLMMVAAKIEDVPSCSALIEAAEAIAALITEYCPIAATEKRVGKKQQRDNLMRVAGFVAIGSIPDCQELYLAAETIAALIAEHCAIAKRKR